MNTKIVMLGIAVVAIGLFALPETMALFTGQHDWYDTKGTDPADPTAIPCRKCHADIGSELSQPGYPNAAHSAQDCKGCHIITAPAKRGLTFGGPKGKDFHAAAAPMCLDCHGGTGPGGDARSILEGPEEVHKPFVNQSNSSQLLKGNNEACLACHTHIAVNITWSKATTLEFGATESVLPDGNHTWTVGNFTATGVNITKTSGSP